MIKLFGLHTILILALVLMSVNSAFVAQNPSDTINQKDSLYKKQGYWKIYAHMRNEPGYKPEEIIEEGNYLNSRKTGLWIRYYPGGKIKSKINYKHGKAIGEYEVYYPSGCLEAKGNWNKTSIIYRYLDNCGDSVKGKIDRIDTIVEFYKVNTSHTFSDSLVINYKNFTANEIKFDKQKCPILNDTINGHYAIYNKENQLILKGLFEKGKLKEGRQYVYDKIGLLDNIYGFIDFKYIGNKFIE